MLDYLEYKSIPGKKKNKVMLYNKKLTVKKIMLYNKQE